MRRYTWRESALMISVSSSAARAAASVVFPDAVGPNMAIKSGAGIEFVVWLFLVTPAKITQNRIECAKLLSKKSRLPVVRKGHGSCASGACCVCGRTKCLFR